MNDNHADDLIISISTDQATLRRSIQRIERDLGTLSGSVKRQFDGIGKSVDSSVSSALQTRINAMVGVGMKASKEWSGALADQGKELDRLRAKYSPLFAVISNYKSAQSEIRKAHALGAISSAEFTAAMSKERQAALASAAALKGRAQAGSNDNRFAATNFMFQAQDIITTAAGGMNPGLIGLQQGSQLAGGFAGMGAKDVGKTLVGGLAQLASPLSIATVGLTALAAAGIQWGVAAITSGTQTTKLDDALEKHGGVLKRLEDRYGALTERAKGFGESGSAALKFDLSSDVRGLKNSTKVAGDDFFKSVGTQTRGGFVTDKAWFGLAEGFRPFNDAVTKLRNEVKAGKPDFDAFFDSIYKTANLDPGYAKKADELAKLVAQFREGNRALEEAQRIQAAIDREDTRPGLRDRRDMSYTNQRDNALKISNGQFDADQQMARARTNAERLAATEAQVRSRAAQDGDSGGGLQARVDRALAEERTRQEVERRNAALQRSQSMDKMLEDQKLELDLIGKTGGAAEALRRQYELISQLKLEAAQKGETADEAEIARIKEKTDLLAKSVNLYNQRKFDFDLDQQAGDARLNDRQRQIIQTQRQNSLPENLNDDNARKIGQQLDWLDAKSAAKSFGAAFSSELVSGSHDIGKALLKGLETTLETQAAKLWDRVFDSLGNVFADFLTGTKSGGSSTASGAGALVSSVFGKAPVTPVTRAALPDISAQSTDVAKYIASAATQRGIDPNIALKVARSEGGLNSWNSQSGVWKNGVQEPSFGPYQLYMGGGLGNSFMKKTGLDPRLSDNGPAGVDYALDHAKQNGWGSWYGAAKVGVGKWDGLGVDKTANSASEALEKLASSGKEAAGGLGKLGQQLSTSFFPAAPSAPGGGGGMGWLSSLFSPGLSAADIAKYTPMVGLFADGGPISGPGTGTSDSIPTMLSNGEFVVNASASKKHRALLHAINNGSIGHMADGGLVSRAPVPVAPALKPKSGTQSGRGDTSLNVTITGANGDDHVRMLVKQGVGAALADQNDQMRRGGFGVMQARYGSQKG